MRIQNVSLRTKLEKDPSRGWELMKLLKVTGIRPLAPVQNSVSLEANATKNIEFHDTFTRWRKYNRMT